MRALENEVKTLKSTIVELNKRLIALESVGVQLCYYGRMCVTVINVFIITVCREEW